MFDTGLNPTPKASVDLTSVKSWRLILIGTTENWVLEKTFLARLKPYLETSDNKFGFKSGDSAQHAIEMV